MQRKETKRFKSYSYDKIIKRDKDSLDIFWLHDESTNDPENLPEPKVLADTIFQNLTLALNSVNELIANLNNKTNLNDNI